MSWKDTGTITFIAGALISAGRRVRLVSGTTTNPPQVEHCPGADTGIGVAVVDAVSGQELAVRLYKASGTHEVTADAAFAIGDPLYGAASGRVTATIGGADLSAIALEAATAQGDIVEVLFQ